MDHTFATPGWSLHRYVVSTTPETFGTVVASNVDGVPVTWQPTRCFEQFANRDSPCPDCPLGPSTTTASTQIRKSAAGYELVQVARSPNVAEAVISRLRLETETLVVLQQAHLQTIASEAKLTQRELLVLERLVRGDERAQIAEDLGITPRTVKFHQVNLFQKLGVDSRGALLQRVLFDGDRR